MLRRPERTRTTRTIEEERTGSSTIRQRGSANRQEKALWIGISVVLWLGLFGGGVYFAKQYFETQQAALEQQVHNIKLQNEEMLAELADLSAGMSATAEEMTQVQAELAYIKEELELTGATLTGSDQTKQALQERMVELDQRLEQLRKQLAKLEEAARAY